MMAVKDDDDNDDDPDNDGNDDGICDADGDCHDYQAGPRGQTCCPDMMMVIML